MKNALIQTVIQRTSIQKALVVSALVFSSLNAFATTNSDLAHDQSYLTVGSVEIQDLSAQYPQESRTTESLNTLSLSPALARSNFEALDPVNARLNQIDMAVDKIINIGTKIWNVIEAGRPVSNYQRAQANALPEGARSWQQLENWQRPTSKVFGVTYKNLYGMEVVKFVYRVILLYGGSANGTGRYIGYASVEPVEINVAFMYSFNAAASVPSVYNMGTRAAPVAGMLLNMNWTVETVLKKSTNGAAFSVDALGNIRAAQGSQNLN